MASENEQKPNAPSNSIEKILLHEPFLPSVARKITEILKGCQRGQNKNIKRFLKQLNSDAKLHRTSLLIEAVRSHRDDALRLLLENGNNVNVEDMDGNSPLHLALLTGQKGMAIILLHYGASVDSVNVTGQTPLHIASQQRLPSLVRKILGMGAEVNALDKDKRTPLIMAAFGGCVTVVTTLLKHGADLSIKDVRGWDALGYAKICNYSDIIHVLSGNFNPKNLPASTSSSSSCNVLGRIDSNTHSNVFSTRTSGTISDEPFLVCRSSAAAGDRGSINSQRSQDIRSFFKSKTDLIEAYAKYHEPRGNLTKLRTLSVSSLTDRGKDLTYTRAKLVLSQARRRIENELQWRRTMLNALNRMDEELERMEQRFRRETRDKQASEQAAEVVDTKLDKLTRHLKVIKAENENLRCQHSAFENGLQAASLRKKVSFDDLIGRDYRGLLDGLKDHADEVKQTSESVGMYLKQENHSNMEILDPLSKLVFSCTEDRSQSDHELVIRLNAPLKYIWMCMWIMASDIKITELLLNNQRSKNTMQQNAVIKIVNLSDDITEEYQQILKAFYEGKAHQDMLDTLANELDVGVKDCLYVINAMAMM